MSGQYGVRESENLYATEQQRNLLLQSKATQEFPWLVALLKKQENIPPKLVATLPKDQQIFMENTFPKVWKAALAEWVADLRCHDNVEVSVQCSLCNTANKYIFFIYNRVNGIRMNVGSDCIHKFDISNTLGLDRDQAQAHIRTIKSNIKNLTRLNEFFQYYPGADILIQTWINEFRSLPIIVSNELEAEHRNCINIGRKLLFKDFLGKMRNDAIILSEFQQNIERRNAVWEKIQAFIRDSEMSGFSFTPRMRQWLQFRGRQQVVDKIMKYGQVTNATIYEIWEPEFFNKLIPRLNRLLKRVNPNLAIIGFDDTKDKVTLQYVHSELQLNVEYPIKKLLLTFGDDIFSRGNGYPSLFAYERASVTDEKSIDKIVGIISERLLLTQVPLKPNYTYRVDFHDISFNELIIVEAFNHTENGFCPVKLDSLVNATVQSLLRDQNFVLIDEALLNTLRSPLVWQPINELYAYKNMRLTGEMDTQAELRARGIK
ncbi:MAG: hypothetical protein M0Z41_08935 [Peptococcaceae bacterium]|nr:hypothetical protein [Peptococcaceae bacterium]